MDTVLPLPPPPPPGLPAPPMPPLALSLLTFLELATYPTSSPEAHDVVNKEALRLANAPMTLVKAVRTRLGGEETMATVEAMENEMKLLQHVSQRPWAVMSSLFMFLLREAKQAVIPDGTHDALLRMVESAIEKIPKPEPKPRKRRGPRSKGGSGGDDDEGNSTGEAHGSSSEEEENGDDDDDDDDAGNKEPTTAVEFARYQACNSQIQTRELIEAIELASLEIRQVLKRIFRLLNIVVQQHPVMERAETIFELADIFGGLVCRPSGSIYYSIRHRQEMYLIRIAVALLIERHEQLVTTYDGLERKPTPPPPVSTEPVFQVQSLPVVAVLKKESSSVSGRGSGGFGSYGDTSPSSTPVAIPTTGGGGLGRGVEDFVSMQRGHHRRKTPPRMTLELMNKRRIELEAVESLANFVVQNAVFGGATTLSSEERVEMWLESAMGIPPQNRPKVWATISRVAEEKRILKRRIFAWEKEFEAKTGRQAGRDDRQHIRGVIIAYTNLKALLVALQQQQQQQQQQQPNQETLPSGGNTTTTTTTTTTLVTLEKKSLQAILKLFEWDFEAKHGRPVEPGDIGEREMEYERYKYLKRTSGSTTTTR